ncbi:MAG: hypothetical protein IIC64_05065 [SAR324 cluster bacterium]|nr:hypothetical protein [SAR324 cluster bacterium]
MTQITSDGLFTTVVERTLPFWGSTGDVSDPGKVVEMLDFTDKEIAIASRIQQNQVKLRGKIPDELIKHIKAWAFLLERVAQFFGGDQEKTVRWFKTPNYQLGGVEPRNFILFGRARKLMEIVDYAVSENAHKNQ